MAGIESHLCFMKKSPPIYRMEGKMLTPKPGRDHLSKYNSVHCETLTRFRPGNGFLQSRLSIGSVKDKYSVKGIENWHIYDFH